eukprot:3748710-Rhodomonas_salina.2
MKCQLTSCGNGADLAPRLFPRAMKEEGGCSVQVRVSGCGGVRGGMAGAGREGRAARAPQAPPLLLHSSPLRPLSP